LDGTTTVNQLAELSRTPKSIIETDLEYLVTSNLLSVIGDKVNIGNEQRIALAIEALKGGSDPERVCRKLNWKEFEEVAMIALDSNGYITSKHFVFKHGKVRREIDLVCVKGKLVLCIDCKHWMHGWHRSRMTSAVREQVERTKALAAEASSVTKRLNLPHLTEFTFLPILVTLADVASRTIQNVPVVPILRMRTFLDGLSSLVSPPFLSFIGNINRLSTYFERSA
jgi:Holliday junction resolvase-like predicted endonuclease